MNMNMNINSFERFNEKNLQTQKFFWPIKILARQ